MGGWGRKLMLITPTGDALPATQRKLFRDLHFET